jgi:hypothetical protein
MKKLDIPRCLECAGDALVSRACRSLRLVYMLFEGFTRSMRQHGLALTVR